MWKGACLHVWAQKNPKHKKKTQSHAPYMHRRQTKTVICARKLHLKSCWLLSQQTDGEEKKRTEADGERLKSTCIPTWPCWRRLSPPAAGCHSGTQWWSWPEPWGQHLIQPRWKPLCSSCGVLLHCPQQGLSACTFIDSRGACVTHSMAHSIWKWTFFF